MGDGIPVSDLDLFHDDALAEPYEHYVDLRRLGPVVWMERLDMYALPRYVEVSDALANASWFCSGQGRSRRATLA